MAGRRLSTQAQSLSIKGHVTDASQEAVIAANVSLWTIDSTLVTGVTSDAQGKFALHKIKAGDYRLSISFIGLQSENIFVEGGKLILKDENQRSFQSLNAELMAGINGATLFGLKDFLTLYASGGYTRSGSEGLNYSHMYDEFYYSVMAQVQYKDFSLLGQFRKVQNNFFGETIKKNENQTAFMAMYTRQNLQAGIGIMFPFTNNYKVGKERISKVAPFRSETFVRETGQMVVLRVGYTFEFGRKHKAGNKGLNNSDTDSGIINMQR